MLKPINEEELCFKRELLWCSGICELFSVELLQFKLCEFYL